MLVNYLCMIRVFYYSTNGPDERNTKSCLIYSYSYIQFTAIKQSYELPYLHCPSALPPPQFGVKLAGRKH